MNFVRTLSLFILSLFFVNKVSACSCVNDIKDLNSEYQLDPYEFVALVKITDDKVYKKSTTKDHRSVGLLGIKILELFKGEPVQEIFEEDIQTSCDMGIEKGQEWMLFGKKINGKLSIIPCDRNAKYKDLNGFREWRRHAYTDLIALRKLYKHPVKTYGTEKRIEYYANKQTEIEENYINGKLDGARKIWYPNGVLFGMQHFKMDSLHGRSDWFYPSGQIQKSDFYIDGKSAHISRFYYDSKKLQSESSSQVRFETVFDSFGNPIVSKVFDSDGRLQSESFIDLVKKTRTTVYYQRNCFVAEISYTKDDQSFGHYIRYGENGLPSREWDYDEKGRVIRQK
jgi:antitoxin component YwqK of YwqJK toxin-antitoxin module